MCLTIDTNMLILAGNGWLFNRCYPFAFYISNIGIGNDRPSQRDFSPDTCRDDCQHGIQYLIDKHSLYDHLKVQYIKDLNTVEETEIRTEQVIIDSGMHTKSSNYEPNLAGAIRKFNFHS